MLDLDERGIPGVMIATTAFREAAAAQSQSLGYEPAIVWVPHPIQNRSDEELLAIRRRGDDGDRREAHPADPLMPESTGQQGRSTVPVLDRSGGRTCPQECR